MSKDIDNSEFINNLYSSAGEQLRHSVKDWANYDQWKEAVSKLDKIRKAVYLIGVLNQQILNGGFMQYFDNSYGMFGYETLRALLAIGASERASMLEKALQIVNQENLNELEFSKFIMHKIIDEERGVELDHLDNHYYSLEDSEDLEELLGNWIKAEPNMRYDEWP